jgi:hypothetical protein
MKNLLAAAILAWSTPALALDLELYAALLARHTRAVADAAGTRVDYAALRADPGWGRLVATLAAAEPGALATRAERLAFWINAYNVLAIDWIVREGPVASIRDLGSLLRPVWKKKAGEIGGRDVTLDQIEHGILRPLGEPRIHVAIVCASSSCPSLRREPFRAAELERQLDEQARAFLADPRKGLAVDRAARTARVSKIFDWFARDFDASGGVRAFLARHAPGPERAWLAEQGDALELRYLEYDWGLNGTGS